MKHAEKHPDLDVEDCYGCHISSVLRNPIVGMARMAKQREEGITSRQFESEIIEDARQAGRDLYRADEFKNQVWRNR